MRSRRLWATVLAMAVLWPPLWGTAEGRAEVGLALAAAGGDATPRQMPRAHFAEQPAGFDLVVSGAESCPQVQAVLLQVTARLEAEIERRWIVDCDRADEAFAGTAAHLAFHFVTPRVERTSRFEWRFLLCDDGGCRKALRVPFEVFPQDILSPIRDWAARDSLVVADRRGALADFLDQARIDFALRPSGVAKGSRVVSFLVADAGGIKPAEMASYLERGPVVLFREEAASLPMVRSRQVAGATLVTVELPLIADLATSPRAQSALLEIFQMLFERADNI